MNALCRSRRHGCRPDEMLTALVLLPQRVPRFGFKMMFFVVAAGYRSVMRSRPQSGNKGDSWRLSACLIVGYGRPVEVCIWHSTCLVWSAT